jgi:PAS domain S-box-containing protein
MEEAGPSAQRLNELLAKATRAAYAASTVQGPDVFGRLAEQLADILGIAAALISTRAEQPGFMLARATRLDGRLLAPFEYELAGTPWRNAVRAESRFDSGGLSSDLPPGSPFHSQGFASYAAQTLLDSSGRELGLIVALDRATMADRAVTEAVLQIFAVRVSAELERERSHAVLRASEASYRSIFEVNEDAIFVHDWATGAILDVSPKAGELYGYPREALRHMRIGDISANVPPYTEQDAVARIEEAKLNPGPVRFEWRARHRDGHLMWNDVTLKRAEIAGARRVLAFVRDVTERKHAEEAIRASEEQYRSIFNASVDAMVLWDAQLRRVDINPAYEHLFGLTREQVLAGTGFEHLPVEYTEVRRELVRRSLAGERCQVELESIRRDGQRLHVEVRTIPIQHRGEPHVLAIVRDITERKEREEDLRRSEGRLRATVEVALDAVVGMNGRGAIIEFNAAAERCFGWRREQVLGKSLADLIVPPRYRQDHLDGMERYLRTGDGPYLGRRVEVEALRADGSEFPAELAIGVAQSRDGPIFIGFLRDITERKRADEALRAGEEQYRAIFNASVDGLILKDADQRIVDVNDAFLSMHGYRREVVLGRHLSEFVPADLQARCDALLPGIIAGEACRLEARSQHSDGTLFDVEIQGVPMQYGGRPHALIIVKNINESKAAADALVMREQQYRAIFEGSADAMVLWNAEVRFVDVNRAYTEIYGFTREEVIGTTLDGRLPPPTVAERTACIRAALAGEERVIETKTLRKNGEEFDVELRYLPITHLGAPHALAIARDITERKRTEQALRASDRQYRSIFNASADALVLRDADFRIVDVNATYESMSGRARDEVIGIDRVLANPPEVGETIKGLHQRALAGEPIVFETQLVRRDGARYELELRGVPIQHRGAPHVLYMGRDITARRRAEDQQRELQAQLLQVQKMEAIGQLTGGIAHDFNNILAAIMGYVALAGERPAAESDAKLAEYLEHAEQGCRRARDLIRQMLAFSGGRRGERRALSLAALIDESLRLLRATFPSSIDLDVEAADVAAVAEVDPVQLQQVLLNLGINARDAIGNTGRIRFGVQQGTRASHVCASCGQSFSGTFHRLWVADSGPGIAPEQRARIFEPFFSTKAPGRGTGMGLATVHRIVHDHGGHLLVESDHGARFEVLLPAEHGATAASPTSEAAAPTPRGALLRGRVLLVDDEESVLGFMHELLRSWGLDVVAMRQAPAARDLLAADGPEFDLLITDQTMPELSGADLAHAAQSSRPKLPVLLYSGHADLIDVKALKQAGIRRVLRKPLEPAELHSAIDECLRP